MKIVWMHNPEKTYCMAENEEYIGWYSGVMLYNGESVQNLASMAEDFFSGSVDYNNVTGFFRAVFFSKSEEKYLFFGDNSGSQYFFIDQENNCFSDRLLPLCAMRKECSPDFEAVVECLDWGRVLGEKTLISGVSKTRYDHYYVREKEQCFAVSKGLMPFSDLPEDISLDDVMKSILRATEGKSMCAVCTGGTDSRAVLANMIDHGLTPDLVITGHLGNPDLPVAQRIADRLGLPLEVISPKEKEQDWIKKGTAFMDGCYDAVLSYRHYQKSRWVQNGGYTIEFGGVGGEFYKNAYCHPFRWKGLRNCGEKVISTILPTKIVSARWCGDALRRVAEENKDVFHLKKLGKEEPGGLFECNRIGFEVLTSSSGAITNGYSNICCKVDPLMDRRLIAAASHDGPVSHSMSVWQRRQVWKHCPEIANIETDQGYTCSMRPTHLIKERLKKLRFWTSRVVARVKKKLRLKSKDIAAHYWDTDYIEARKTAEWKEAVDYCKRVGILAQDVTEEEIPIEKTGWIILIGLVCEDSFRIEEHHCKR